MDHAARTVTQAGHELRLAHIEIGNVEDVTTELLDLYIQVDGLHERIRELMQVLRVRAAA